MMSLKADAERLVARLERLTSGAPAQDDTDPVMLLARLACDQGASFDVVYEVDGSVRVSLYPVEPEAKHAKATHPAAPAD